MNSVKKRLLVALVSVCMVAALGLTACNGNNGSQSDQSSTDQNNTATTDTSSNNNSTDNATNSNSTSNNSTAQQLSGDVIGQVGTEYATKWFTFTVNSLTTSSSYDTMTAASGDTLVIANVTITNTFGSAQPFGTFDWFVDDSSLSDYIYPVAPINSGMMPESYTLQDGDTVTYDVVIEISSSLANPYFMYVEVDSSGNTFSTFSLPIK